MLPILLPALLSTYPIITQHTTTSTTPTPAIDISWYPPKNTSITSLPSALTSSGTNNFIFNSSTNPPGVPYGTYNWCNMPHVRRQEYPLVDEIYTLEYVELIHRHHKRTPYAANTFPVESYPWYCNDSALYYYGAPHNTPIDDDRSSSAPTFWQVFDDSAVNPFPVPGFPGNCQFPQITKQGLDDSWQHGRDLYAVYYDLLHLISSTQGGGGGAAVSFRVTNNVITSQVASTLVNGMFGTTTPFPLLIQPPATDSLEPKYPCLAASALYSTYGVGGTNPAWTKHLIASAPLYAELDALSGVLPNASDWHVSWDHYFDNLSARMCHGKPLPCSIRNSELCVTVEQADEVFRLGEWEYSYIYRGAGPETLEASAASFGVWVAELAEHLVGWRDGIGMGVVYRHNVAHDGSVARLLSILQVEEMVWPGMGSEVVFELYSKRGADRPAGFQWWGYGEDGAVRKQWFVRILWGGQVLRSSSPTLGVVDMLPLETLLAYFDGLVGQRASSIPGKCAVR